MAKSKTKTKNEESNPLAEVAVTAEEALGMPSDDADTVLVPPTEPAPPDEEAEAPALSVEQTAIAEEMDAEVAQADKMAAPPPERPEWEVQKKVTVSWGGQMVTFHAGTVVGFHTHGRAGVQRMRNSGVSLKAMNAAAEAFAGVDIA